MIDRRLQLATRRGELLAQSRMQRQQLARDLAPLVEALHTVDRGLDHLNRAGRWLQRNPAVVAVGVAVLVALRPRKVFGLLRRVWSLRGLLLGAGGVASRFGGLAPVLSEWFRRRR
jgi:hypothetical protein